MRLDLARALVRQRASARCPLLQSPVLSFSQAASGGRVGVEERARMPDPDRPRASILRQFCQFRGYTRDPPHRRGGCRIVCHGYASRGPQAPTMPAEPATRAPPEVMPFDGRATIAITSVAAGVSGADPLSPASTTGGNADGACTRHRSGRRVRVAVVLCRADGKAHDIIPSPSAPHVSATARRVCQRRPARPATQRRPQQQARTPLSLVLARRVIARMLHAAGATSSEVAGQGHYTVLLVMIGPR
jgi:hypothetical protein